jgi:hypothetical protein
VLPKGVKRGYDPAERRAVTNRLRPTLRDARPDLRSFRAAFLTGLVTAFPDGEPGKGYREVLGAPGNAAGSGAIREFDLLR